MTNHMEEDTRSQELGSGKQVHTATSADTHTVYLALGSNLGRRAEALREAIRRISESIGKVDRQSSFIETEPWGFESAHRFLNAAVRCRTRLSPREVLQQTQAIEQQMGRTRKTDAAQGYSDRPIDIDILLYDDLHLQEPDLVIPHPLMHERDFVMIPLREIMP